jgi:hypothetical protein
MAASSRSPVSGLVMGLVIGLPVGSGVGAGFAFAARNRDEATWVSVPLLVTSTALPAGHVLAEGDFVEGS